MLPHDVLVLVLVSRPLCPTPFASVCRAFRTASWEVYRDNVAEHIDRLADPYLTGQLVAGVALGNLRCEDKEHDIALAQRLEAWIGGFRPVNGAVKRVRELEIDCPHVLDKRWLP